MKRLASLSLALVLALSLALGSTLVVAHADSGDPAPQVAVNSFKVEFPDAQPFIDGNGRTLIPVRFVAEKLGAAVDWDASTSTVLISKDGTNIKMPIGSKGFTVTRGGNTRTVTMDTEALIRDERTYVPIRYVAEELGAFVDWASYYRIVDIVLPDPDSGLTAADIQRLRSYPVNQILTDGQAQNNYVEGLYENYTFANAHYAAVTAKDTTKDYKDYSYQPDRSVPKSEWKAALLPAGSTSYDFSLFVMGMAKANFENTNGEVTTAAFVAKNSNGTTKVVFHTDPSLVYKQKGPAFNLYCIRGVIEINSDHDGGIAEGMYYKANTPAFYDYESVFSAGIDGSVRMSTDYRFDENGTAIRHVTTTY